MGNGDRLAHQGPQTLITRTDFFLWDAMTSVEHPVFDTRNGYLFRYQQDVHCYVVASISSFTDQIQLGLVTKDGLGYEVNTASNEGASRLNGDCHCLVAVSLWILWPTCDGDRVWIDEEGARYCRGEDEPYER